MKSNSSAIGRSARNSSASVERICVFSLLRSFSSSSTEIARFVACESVSMAMNCEVRFVGVENDFAVAEADAVAGMKQRRLGQLHAVERRAVDAAAIAHEPRAALIENLGVTSREEAVLDRNRAIGRAAERDVLAPAA